MDIDAEVKQDQARDDIETATESAHCALINFDNLARLAPMFERNPIFRLARGQLVDAIKLLGREVE